jgi:hypothetical protein
MSSRVLAGILAAGCVTAAAGGAYVAVRQDAASVAAAPAAPAETPAASAEPADRPVSETEAVLSPPQVRQPATSVHDPAPAARKPSLNREREGRQSAAPVARRQPPPAASRETPRPPARPQPAPLPVDVNEPAAAPPVATPPVAAPPVRTTQEPSRVAEQAPAPIPQFDEVVLPSSSVIGLEIDTPLSSERARIEDRVEARVTRDVVADGRLAIPAGSRAVGAVPLVERGGKVKQSARLGLRFHTLVLPDGREVSLSTEPVYREGESPAPDSARKIGGAAIGGAILGAIIGGGKGAVIGGATGAAGGSAVVMSGDRHAATLAPGTIVTVRLSAPAAIELERRQPQN